MYLLYLAQRQTILLSKLNLCFFFFLCLRFHFIDVESNFCKNVAGIGMHLFPLEFTCCLYSAFSYAEFQIKTIVHSHTPLIDDSIHRYNIAKYPNYRHSPVERKCPMHVSLATATQFPQFALLHSVTCVQLRLITILGNCGCVAGASFLGVPSPLNFVLCVGRRNFKIFGVDGLFQAGSLLVPSRECTVRQVSAVHFSALPAVKY
jgi:hypothetical protein